MFAIEYFIFHHIKIKEDIRTFGILITTSSNISWIIFFIWNKTSWSVSSRIKLFFFEYKSAEILFDQADVMAYHSSCLLQSRHFSKHFRPKTSCWNWSRLLSEVNAQRSQPWGRYIFKSRQRQICWSQQLVELILAQIQSTTLKEIELRLVG